MPDFKGSDHIKIQVGDANVAHKFKFKPCTGSTKNDGTIPYGSTLASSTILAYNEQGTAVSTSLAVARSLSSNIVTVYLSHSTAFTDGVYKLTFNNTFSLSGSTRVMSKEYDYNRVYVGNV
jgi:hypothetical protein